jgi:hypothetical protein
MSFTNAMHVSASALLSHAMCRLFSSMMHMALTDSGCSAALAAARCRVQRCFRMLFVVLLLYVHKYSASPKPLLLFASWRAGGRVKHFSSSGHFTGEMEHRKH